MQALAAENVIRCKAETMPTVTTYSFSDVWCRQTVERDNGEANVRQLHTVKHLHYNVTNESVSVTRICK